MIKHLWALEAKDDLIKRAQKWLDYDRSAQHDIGLNDEEYDIWENPSKIITDLLAKIESEVQIPYSEALEKVAKALFNHWQRILIKHSPELATYVWNESQSIWQEQAKAALTALGIVEEK